MWFPLVLFYFFFQGYFGCEGFLIIIILYKILDFFFLYVKNVIGIFIETELNT